MKKKILLDEIDTVFPFVEMPSHDELSFHKDGCSQCDDFLSDLELYRGKEISGEVIRLVHQEMAQLSAKAWAWILPHYLRYCLTSEGEYNRMETEFLIYNLSPSDKFKLDSAMRLSMLNPEQVSYLIKFCDWLLQKPEWKDIYEEDINRAIVFLNALESMGVS